MHSLSGPTHLSGKMLRGRQGDKENQFPQWRAWAFSPYPSLYSPSLRQCSSTLTLLFSVKKGGDLLRDGDLLLPAAVSLSLSARRSIDAKMPFES